MILSTRAAQLCASASCLILLFSILSAPAQADRVISAFDSGRYRGADHSPSNQSYTTGFRNGEEHRGFFMFDPVMDEPIGTAWLMLTGHGGANFAPTDTLTIYDVTTPGEDVRLNISGQATFDDLGSGIVLGNQVLSAPKYNGQYLIPLNEAGKQAIRDAASAEWIAGLTLSPLAGVEDHFLFDGLTIAPAVQLWTTPLANLPLPEKFTLSTQNHPLSSTVNVNFYVGDPRAGGPLIGTAGSRALHGTFDATYAIDQYGNGGLALDKGELVMDAIQNLQLDFGAFGRARVTMSGATFGLASTFLPVIDHQLSMADYSELFLHDGTIRLTNPQGGIGGNFNVSFPVQADFLDSSPNSGLVNMLPLSGSAATRQALFTNGRELNLDFPETYLPVLDFGFTQIWAGVSGQIHVAVPEPSTGMLLALALPLLAWSWRHRRPRPNRR